MRTAAIDNISAKAITKSEIEVLQSAVDAANANQALTEAGFSAEVRTYPKGTTMKEVVADGENSDVDDIEDDLSWYSQTSGKAAVDSFVAILNEATDGDEDAVETQRLCDAIAAAAKEAFTPIEAFASVKIIGHGAGDDLGVEFRSLVGEKKNGSLIVATYWHNPF